jgi:hypothetical protein
MPMLKLGDKKPEPEKPKMGFGLDLTKAKNI